jgi:hypothetical protein
VQAIIDELNGEKIDIIEWIDNAEEMIAQALSPAKVAKVELVEGDEMKDKKETPKESSESDEKNDIAEEEKGVEEIDDSILHSAAKSPVLVVNPDMRIGRITPFNPLIIRLYDRNSPSLDYAYQFKFEEDSNIVIESVKEGVYDIEAYIDVNNTEQLEIGKDIIGGRPARDLDPRVISTFSLNNGNTTEINLLLLTPIDVIYPKPGEVGIGKYGKFYWKEISGVSKYVFKVFKGEKINYMVELNKTSVTYGDIPDGKDGKIIIFPEVLSGNEYYRWSVLGFDSDGVPVAYVYPLRFIP